MKKYAIAFLMGALFAVVLYFLNFFSAIKYIGFAALFIGVALSGTLVSGDRMRGNSQLDSVYSKQKYLYVIVFSLPFLLLLIFTHKL